MVPDLAFLSLGLYRSPKCPSLWQELQTSGSVQGEERQKNRHLGQRLQAHCLSPTFEKLQESQARVGCPGLHLGGDTAAVRAASEWICLVHAVLLATRPVTDSLAILGWQTTPLIFVHLCPVVLHICAHMSPLNEASSHIRPQLTVVTPAKTLFPKKATSAGTWVRCPNMSFGRCNFYLMAFENCSCRCCGVALQFWGSTLMWGL